MTPKEAYIANVCKNVGIDLEGIIRDVYRYIPDFNERKFREAFAFAAHAHEGQFRKENKPYIVHPVEAAKILVSMHADEDTLIACLMHDVPEDTEYKIDQIEAKFGKKVAFLVEGVTKLSKVHFRNDMEERQIESLKKLFIHSAEDPRIIFIKLADRLHNMRTLQYIDKPEKQYRISRETLEIFVPIANLLGIEELKSELEDLCFKFLYRDEYENISDRMKRNKVKNKHVLEATIQLVQKKLDEARVKASVYGRQKSLYSIYKKVVSQGKRLDEVDDLIALRILVAEREDCYSVLGLVHSLFKPKSGKFKDYISVPKSNGYQSLHTTVFGLNGIVTEFQIRTFQMHLEAEYGIAAHYFYDEKKNKVHHLEKDRRAYWAEKILMMQKEQVGANAFFEDLKLDIFQDRIFVFTPHGDPVDLPKGATCIDFAYNIHTEVGHRALKADVNGEIVSLTSALNTGDTVRIITSDKPQAPNREWLGFAKTNIARHKIREYLKQETKEAKIKTGQYLLQKEFDRAGLGLVRNVSARKLKEFAKRFSHIKFRHFEDILIAIGDGTLTALEAFGVLFEKEKIGAKKELGSNKDSQIKEKFTTAAIKISSKNRTGQLEKYLQVMNELGIQLIKSKTYVAFFTGNLICKMTILVKDFQQLSEFCEQIEHLEDVIRAERLFWKRKLSFAILSSFSFITWGAHPYILYTVTRGWATSPFISNIFLYSSLLLLFAMVFSLKRLTQVSFPELRETKALWVLTFTLTLFSLGTFFAEIFYFQLEFNWVIGFAVILLIFSYLTLEYIEYRDRYFR